ncbi:hypothetical protein DL93DRAFT_2072057 [Clavulina sp. PMI_390]|nr:hypothetical protein DL93DRAFT_2072057 [Clavulina sp. PMI_390]
MESPHIRTQAVYLERINRHAGLCLEALRELNAMIEQVNTANEPIEAASQLMMNYRRNVQFNLESTNSLKPPIGVPELAADKKERESQ